MTARSRHDEPPRFALPFSEPSEPDEWEYTTAARIACDSCGEWIYTRRRRGTSNPYVLPSECQVCGAQVGDD